MPATPTEVFARLAAGISAGDWAGLGDLYAEDVVVEMPFAPQPTTLRGADAVRAHFAAAAGGPLRLTTTDVVVHRTEDPEVIVAEFGYLGRTGPGDRTFRVANVQVLRVRDGLIVESRDYHDHRAIAAALGG